jgi:hypothetical protein
MCGRVAVPVAVRARARLPEQQGDGAAVQELLVQRWLDSSQSLMEQAVAEGELVRLRFKYPENK